MLESWAKQSTGVTVGKASSLVKINKQLFSPKSINSKSFDLKCHLSIPSKKCYLAHWVTPVLCALNKTHKLLKDSAGSNNLNLFSQGRHSQELNFASLPHFSAHPWDVGGERTTNNFATLSYNPEKVGGGLLSKLNH